MVLDLLLNKVVLDHDPNTLIHTLHIHLKIPLVVGGSTEGVLRGLFRTPPQPPSTQGDQLSPVRNYSTVTKYSPTGLDPHLDKGYHLTMVLEVSSPNLWMSPYSQHQQMLFDLIRSKHEDEGWNFKKISDWLVENNYSTPRGKVFTQSHVWSMYTKKKRSIERFSRKIDPKVISTDILCENWLCE